MISILGVILGVAVLVIVLSVMSGFDDMWRDKILNFNAHITVSHQDAIQEIPFTLNQIQEINEVTGVAPFVQGPVFLEFQGQVFTPIAKGIEPEMEKLVSLIPEYIKSGQFVVEEDQAVIGHDLAKQLGLRVGDRLLLYSPRGLTQSDEVQLPEEVTVGGIFELGMWEFDMGYVLVSLELARDLYDMNEQIHAIQVAIENPLKAAHVAHNIRETLGPGFEVRTWMELNKQLFAALRVEKNMMFFLLIIITLVAAFGVMNTLITVAVQKTNEIGLLKALGFTLGSIMSVFFWLGFIEGCMGTFCGVITGLVVLHYRNDLLLWLSNTYDLELFPKQLYHLSEIPASISLWDIGLVSILAVIMCTLAGVVAAYRAARLEPVQALQL